MRCREWKEVRLGEVCKIRRGSSPRPIKDYISEDGMPWVKIADATECNSRFIYSTKQKIKFEGVKNSVVVNPGALILSNSGTAGLPKFMGITACIHDGWQVFEDYNSIENNFLYYNLLYLRDKLLHGAYDSTMKNLTLDMVRSAMISLPLLEEQKAIAHILSTLDEKIETNNRINKKLEEMAQLIFKHWFVDFEFPNQDGDPYKSSGGEMVESELGMIPKGWEVKELSEIVDMKNGVNYSRDNTGEAIKVVNVRDFDGGMIIDDSKLDEIYLPKKKIKTYLLSKFDTVVVRSAKPGETLLVIDSKEKIYSGFTIRVRSKDQRLKIYTFNHLRVSLQVLNNSSNGTIFKNLNQKLLGSLKTIVPDYRTLDIFDGLIEILLKKIECNNNEINVIKTLRDTLLPKLMSGQIRVAMKEGE